MCSATRPRRTRSRLDGHATRSKFSGNKINLADYLKSINGNTSLPALKSKFLHKVRTSSVPAVHAKRAKARAVTLEHRAKAAVVARPKIPALFRSDVKMVVVKHVAQIARASLKRLNRRTRIDNPSHGEFAPIVRLTGPRGA